jgi:sporulation integral membrane protein YlbJ
MCTFIVLLFFKNSDAAALWVSKGLTLCAKKLIPALFPFMVLSSLILSCGLGKILSRLFRLPARVLFGLSESSACACIMGWICGFPLGAKCALELYEGGKITLEEYNRVLCICSTPSPAFLISGVGASMLGNKKYGIWLYTISLVSAVCVGVFLKFKAPLSNTTSYSRVAEKREGFASMLTRAVSDAASGMLSVCAFVVFFSAFLGALEMSVGFLKLSEVAHSLLFCFFELTSGLSKISSSGIQNEFPLCALAVGWSGLSVHFQTMAICTSSTSKPSFKGYIISHAARSAICLSLGVLVDIFIL